MGIFESLNPFSSPEQPSQEAKMRAAKERQLQELIERRNAIMANQAEGFKARSGESNIDTRELTTINDNIKLLENELGKNDAEEASPEIGDEKTIH